MFVRSCLHVDPVTLFQAALNQVLGLYGSEFVDHCEDESLLKDFAQLEHQTFDQSTYLTLETQHLHVI